MPAPGERPAGSAPTQRHAVREWVVDVLVGGLLGGAVGAIVSVNVVITSGVERGYESGPAEVFGHSTVAGLVAVAALIAGPILGVVVARRRRPR